MVGLRVYDSVRSGGVIVSFFSDGEDCVEDSGPIFLNDVFCQFFAFMNHFNSSSFSNLSKYGLYLSPCCQIISVYLVRVSFLELINGVRLLVPLTMGHPETDLLRSGAYFWSHQRPIICTFSFSANVEATGKGFLENGGRKIYSTAGFTKPLLVAGIPIPGETEIIASSKGLFGSK